MAESRNHWTNQEILDEFLGSIVKEIYQTASQSIDVICEAAAEANPHRLRDRLVATQIGIVASIFALIDGASGPSSWPGIKLVNAETGEPLTNDLRWELSRVEGKYIEATEPPLEDD